MSYLLNSYNVMKFGRTHMFIELVGTGRYALGDKLCKANELTMVPYKGDVWVVIVLLIIVLLCVDAIPYDMIVVRTNI